MRLGIMQPYFFPYIGYFSLMKQVDEFILLDDVQFIRHGWIERNRILKPSGGWQYIAIPLKKHDQKCPIKDVRIDNSHDWKRKLLAQLVHYKRSPYYYKVLGVLKELFEKDFETITEFDRDSLTKIAKYLEITTPIRLFREMNLEIETVKCADEWALNICKAIPDATEYWNPPGGRSFFNSQKYMDAKLDIKFEEVEITEYSQKGADFEAGLSIIDVMMFNSVEEINRMLDRYKIYDGNYNRIFRSP